MDDKEKSDGGAPACPHPTEWTTEPHSCPYSEEIGGNYELQCRCCDACRHQCLMDI